LDNLYSSINQKNNFPEPLQPGLYAFYLNVSGVWTMWWRDTCVLLSPFSFIQM